MKTMLQHLLRMAHSLYDPDDPEPFAAAVRRAARFLDDDKLLVVGIACGSEGDGRLVLLDRCEVDPDALGRAFENCVRRALAAGSPGAIVTVLDRDGSGRRFYIEPIVEGLTRN